MLTLRKTRVLGYFPPTDPPYIVMVFVVIMELKHSSKRRKGSEHSSASQREITIPRAEENIILGEDVKVANEEINMEEEEVRKRDGKGERTEEGKREGEGEREREGEEEKGGEGPKKKSGGRVYQFCENWLKIYPWLTFDAFAGKMKCK
eukprot:TRINITY_DN41730_c0_g1_i1.p2 TRINITY_DN41730_c0_g1~~TRINITY_DN41730_c0_g1_i1.p2  ORF type:complete len:149 (+),score=25.13 TRINITY_DN41730_c0_g1_i1:374-820(+)